MNIRHNIKFVKGKNISSGDNSNIGEKDLFKILEVF